MNPKANPLLLAMFILMCATIPAAGVIPSVIAQEYTTSLGEDFAGSIVSDVLDGDDDDEVDQDSSANDNILVDENEFGDGTQVAVPISDQDQTAENRAINLDLDIDEDLDYGDIVGGDGDRDCTGLPPPFRVLCEAGLAGPPGQAR
jgi:hypothetical protein